MLHCPRDIMRYAIFFLGVASAMTTAPALAADPTGDWRVADGVANIRVAECNGNMWGAVVWEKEPGGLDAHNPDASKNYGRHPHDDKNDTGSEADKRNPRRRRYLPNPRHRAAFPLTQVETATRRRAS